MYFTNLVNEICQLNKFDILLIDTGAGLNEYIYEFLDISDKIIAVTTTDPSAITDAYALIKMLSKTKDELFLCFNHIKNQLIGEKITQSIKDLAKKNRLNRNFMVKYIGGICYTENIQTTARLRKLFAKEFMSDDATIQMDNVTTNILREL